MAGLDTDEPCVILVVNRHMRVPDLGTGEALAGDTGRQAGSSGVGVHLVRLGAYHPIQWRIQFFSRIYGTGLYVFEALHNIKKSPDPWTLVFLFLLTLVFITGALNLHGLDRGLLPFRRARGSGVILVHGKKEGLGVPAGGKRHQGGHRVVVAVFLLHGLASTNGDPLHRRVALPRLVRREGDPLARTPLLPRHAQPLALVEAGAPNQAHAGRLGCGVGEEAPARALLARVHKAAAGGNGLALRVLYREDATRAVDAGLGRIQVRRVECGVVKPLDLVRHVLLLSG